MIALKKLCKLEVNLRTLPEDAFHAKSGPLGDYYEARFAMGLVFGAGGLEFRALYEGNVIGSVDCDYY